MKNSSNTTFESAIEMYSELKRNQSIIEDLEKVKPWAKQESWTIQDRKKRDAALSEINSIHADLQDWFCGSGGDRIDKQTIAYIQNPRLYKEMYQAVYSKNFWSDHLEWLLPELKEMGVKICQQEAQLTKVRQNERDLLDELEKVKGKKNVERYNHITTLKQIEGDCQTALEHLAKMNFGEARSTVSQIKEFVMNHLA